LLDGKPFTLTPRLSRSVNAYLPRHHRQEIAQRGTSGRRLSRRDGADLEGEFLEGLEDA
jgi:hypothetical protein